MRQSSQSASGYRAFAILSKSSPVHSSQSIERAQMLGLEPGSLADSQALRFLGHRMVFLIVRFTIITQNLIFHSHPVKLATSHSLF